MGSQENWEQLFRAANSNNPLTVLANGYVISAWIDNADNYFVRFLGCGDGSSYPHVANYGYTTNSMQESATITDYQCAVDMTESELESVATDLLANTVANADNFELTLLENMDNVIMPQYARDI